MTHKEGFYDTSQYSWIDYSIQTKSLHAFKSGLSGVKDEIPWNLWCEIISRASSNKLWPIVEYILSKKYIDLEIAFPFAARIGDFDLVDILIKHGATSFDCAIIAAAKQNNATMISYLMQESKNKMHSFLQEQLKNQSYCLQIYCRKIELMETATNKMLEYLNDADKNNTKTIEVLKDATKLIEQSKTCNLYAIDL